MYRMEERQRDIKDETLVIPCLHEGTTFFFCVLQCGLAALDIELETDGHEQEIEGRSRRNESAGGASGRRIGLLDQSSHVNFALWGPFSGVTIDLR
jgi:hypothetical protein